MARRMEDLETIIPDFNQWDGLPDRRFEQEFLLPRLIALGWTKYVHFCGGYEFTGGECGPVYSNRTVKVANEHEKKEYKYGR